MNNRIKLLLLPAIMLLANLVAYAYDFEANGLYYNVLSEDDRTVQITHPSPIVDYTSGELYIPSKVVYNSQTYTVTQIGLQAFAACESLTSVHIPNSVTYISSYAFSNCSGLISIEIPNSVTEIWGGVFDGCISLKTIAIPNSVKEIGGYAFDGCISLTTIAIPNSVKEIGEGAFAGCSSLKSVSIGNSVKEIVRNVFMDCANLTTVEFSNSLEEIGDYSFRNCTSLRVVDIPSSVMKIGSNAFFRCYGLESINVDPDNKYLSSIDGLLYFKDATVLKRCCQGKKSVAIPNSVTTIEERAFEDCTLTSVVIPNSVTTIGGYTFQNCKNLSSITLSSSLISIEKQSFRDCSSLPTIDIPNSVVTIEADAFGKCSSLTSVSFGSSVKTIGEPDEGVFNGCKNLTEISCRAIKPPSATFWSGNDAYDSRKYYNQIMLYVPKASKRDYESVVPWCNCKSIVGTMFSGIDNPTIEGDFTVKVVNGNIVVEGTEEATVEVYDLGGRLVARTNQSTISDLSTGIYIVKVNGQTIKVSL